MNSAPCPVDVLAFPFYPDNPWQSIVYGDAVRSGATVTALSDLGGLIEHRIPTAGRTRVLHMNWTTPIAQTARDARSAMDRVEDARAQIDAFVASGGRVVWSIHNVTPHEMPHLLPEVILCRYLAGIAEAVVVMNPSTPTAVADLYPLDPDRTVHIDHPSYLGVFPNEIGRAPARTSFGLDASHRVLLFLGTLRPYKGLENLLDAFGHMYSADPRYRLLIAGRPGGGYTADDIRGLVGSQRGVTLHPDHVDNADVQRWMGAADLITLPYLRALNVSVVSLAASFAKPVALRALPDLSSLAGQTWVRWIRGAGPDLAESIASAWEDSRTEEIAEAARRFAHATRPAVVSARYRELLSDLADRR